MYFLPKLCLCIYKYIALFGLGCDCGFLAEDSRLRLVLALFSLPHASFGRTHLWDPEHIWTLLSNLQANAEWLRVSVPYQGRHIHHLFL